MLSFLFHNHLSDQYPAEFGNPFSPIPDEWQWNKSCGTKLDWLDSEMSLLLIYPALSSPLSSTWVAASVIISGLIQENAFHWPSIGEF